MCSHNASLEGLRGRDGYKPTPRLTPGQDEERELTPEELDALLEQKILDLKEARRRRHAKAYPKTKAIRQESIKNKLFYCHDCKVAARDKFELARHLNSDRHLEWAKKGGKGNLYSCGPCSFSTKFLSNFKQHQESKGHLARVEYAADVELGLEPTVVVPKAKERKAFTPPPI